MVYFDEWDETEPPGTAPANTIDTIIQELKRDIRERLEGSAGDGPLPDFGNPAGSEVDPLRVVIHTGTSRPSSPNLGELFYNSDSGELDIYDGTDWQVLVSAGTEEGVQTSLETQLAAQAITIGGAYTTVTHSFSATYNPVNYAVIVCRFRFREASVPGSWSRWWYHGSNHSDNSIHFGVGKPGAGNGSIFPAAIRLSAANTDDRFSVFLTFYNSSTDQAESIDVEIQLVLLGLSTELATS